MAEQVTKPVEHTELYWFSEQSYGHITDEIVGRYESGRLGFPNTHFDPEKAHVLYNQYHEQYALADEVGFDGIMTNEHHSAYWCMKPAANLDAAVICKVTKRVKIAILGNVISVNDPVRMAGEIAMLDCYSGGRIISGFVRGTAVESIQGGIDPTLNRERFEEAHDLIIKCWTTPGPFRYEGKHYHYRAVNPWVLPIQKPHPDIWFPGNASPESVVWAARHRHPYMNLGALIDLTDWLRKIYIQTAREEGFRAGPEHFGYLLRALVADTDEKAQEIGRDFMWTGEHRMRAPRKHNDPPGGRIGLEPRTHTIAGYEKEASMVAQLPRPKDKVEVYWFSEQPYGPVTDEDLSPYESARLGFPNTYFDPQKAHVLYNQYHEQYALADEVGFDGIMTNEHHSSYWCMKPAVNLDAAVISKVTKHAKIAILGNVISVNDPIRMAEEIAMLDCYSGGRIISGFVRGTAVETLHSGLDPTENRERFEEAHDLIIKCWTEPGPFRYEGKHYQYRAVNPWVVPMQKPHPDIWFPGSGSPESVIWAAKHGHPYMCLGALIDMTAWLKGIYIDTAKESGFKAGPEHFGYLLRALVADTDEKAQEIGRNFMWTENHRMRGPREHNDPPGYQSREALRVKRQRPQIGAGGEGTRMSYEQLQSLNNIVIGSPDTVIRKLTEVVEHLSPGYLHIYGNEGPMAHKDAIRSIELFGQEVIPALHEIKLQPYE